MSLTGIPLILLAVLATTTVLGATIVLWNRLKRLRLPVRFAGVLLTEALLLLSVGLAANRSEQFYPSWEALLQTGSTAPATYRTAPGHLDGWLKAQAGQQPQQPFTFAWKPAGWTRWRLTTAPTVVLPGGYLLHPTWRYPVVLVLGEPAGTWTDSALSVAAAAAGPAVIVLVRATPAAAPATFAGDLPGRLGTDLRVSAHRWALVAAAPQSPLGRLVVRRAPGRYPAFAELQSSGHVVEVGAAAPVALPAGIDTMIIHAAAGLRGALIWAVEHTPPPLAPSSPSVTYVPIHHPPKGHLSPQRRPGPKASVSSTTAAIAAGPRGGRHVSGQPHR